MIGCGKVQQLVRSDDLVGEFTKGETNMIKEILIAGLAFSAPSADSYLTTHYKNNTQYEEFRCDACNRYGHEKVNISYINDARSDAYIYMDSFLDDYQEEVIKLLEYADMPGTNTQNYCHLLISTLEKKISQQVFHGKISLEPEYVSFTISNDGVLTFQKPFQLTQ